jgi:hypothetical protein
METKCQELEKFAQDVEKEFLCLSIKIDILAANAD